MQTCPDCASIKERAKNDSRFELIDIGEHVRNLKQFLTLRDSEPAFEQVRKKGSVGIPCFVMEDGSIRFSLNEEVQSEENASNASCSIDGKGC